MGIESTSPQSRAVERELWTSFPVASFRYEEQQARDPEVLARMLAQAEAEHDWGKAMLMAEALWREGPPDPAAARRLARALVRVGRHGEALPLLLEPAQALEDPVVGWDLIEAYAGAGRIEEAAQTLQGLPQTDHVELPRQKLQKHVLAARKLGARLERLTDFLDFRLLSEVLRSLGASTQAAEIVRRYFARRLRPTPDQWPEAFESVQMALANLPPENVFALIRDLRQVYTEPPGRELLKRTLSVLAGRCGSDAIAAVELGRHDRSLRFISALACLAAGRRTAALEQLCQLAERYKTDREVRLVLARAVGDELLSHNPVGYRAGGGRKIISLLMFNNEKELLKLKLAEESPWVDHFVLVEAAQTFTGLPKPLYFDAWKSEFAAYADRITHVKVEAFPQWATTAWARDFHQRDMAVTGASNLWGVDDLVLVTDADETVDRRALEGFDGECASMRMETFRYFLNHHLNQGARPTGVVFRAKYFQKFGTSYLRFIMRSSRFVPSLANCGWHFTSVTDGEGLAAKVRAYAHQENDQREAAEYEAMLAKIRGGYIDPDHWEYWPIDERFPAYVREHRERLDDLILPEDVAPASA